MAKIFVRERGNVREGEGKPRLAVIGVVGTDMKFFKTHLRQGELEMIAQSIGAEVVALPRGKGDHAGKEGGGGKRHQGRRRHGAGGDASSA